MSTLGLAAIAGNAAFDQNRVLKDQAYQDQQRAYQGKVMDSELSTLDARTGAIGARAGLDTAQSDATRSMVPAQTRLAQTGLDNAQGAADFAGQVQPVQQGITRAGLDFQARQQPKEQQIAAEATDREIAAIPDKAYQAYATGQATHEDLANHLTGTLGQYIASGDKQKTLTLFNAIAKNGKTFPSTNGKTYNDVRESADKKTVDFVADDGSVIPIPSASINAAMAKIKSGNYTFGHTPGGTVFSGDARTGEIKIGVAGDPNYRNGGADAKQSEMERQYAFLTGHPDGPKLSREKATDMITKGSHKTPEDRYHSYKTELVKAQTKFGDSKLLDLALIDKQARGLAGYNPAGSGAPGLPNAAANPVGGPGISNSPAGSTLPSALDRLLAPPPPR